MRQLDAQAVGVHVKTPIDPRVQRAIALMQERGATPLPLAAIARAVNLSPSRLRHLVKVETGLSPRQALKAFRMQHGEALTATTFLTIKEIAATVGCDESHFIRDFRRTYGVSPTEYRRALGPRGVSIVLASETAAE
jgi:AraC family transcriptional regulator of arabinose operon